MSEYTDKKLGFHEPNLAYDLPEMIIRIRTLIRNGELEGLSTFLDNAQVLLDVVKRDVESHLLLLSHELDRVRTLLNHDHAESGGLQPSQPGTRGQVQ